MELDSTRQTGDLITGPIGLAAFFLIWVGLQEGVGVDCHTDLPRSRTPLVAVVLLCEVQPLEPSFLRSARRSSVLARRYS